MLKGLALVLALHFTSIAAAVQFSSMRIFNGPGLAVGTDLRRQGLIGPQANFPAGKQLVRVKSLGLPYVAGKTQDLFETQKKLLTGFQTALQVVYTANGSPTDRQRTGTRLPKTLAEVAAIPALKGPWSSWLDVDGRLANLAAPKLPYADTVAWGGVDLLACTQDGKVTGTYQDFLLNIPASGRLAVVAKRCTGAGVRPAERALPFRGGGRPRYTLSEPGGKVLDGARMSGPYAVLLPVPDGLYGLDVQEVYRTAAQTLKAAGVPLYVAALPTDTPDGRYLSADTVAASLRASLGVPVYTDKSGTFVDVFSNYLGIQSMLLLFGKHGEILDGLRSNAGPYELPFPLPQVLLEYDLL